MKPRSLGPLCLIPRSSRRSTVCANVACETANARWCTQPGSVGVRSGSGVRSSLVKIVMSRPSPGSKYRWLSPGLSRFGCSKTNGMPRTPSQKSIDIWRSAPTSVMWWTPWLWIFRMWGKLPALDECGRAAKLAAMTFIETVPADDATGDVAAMYDADRELRGFLPNYTQAFSHRPGVYAAWRQLVGAITQNMDPRRYELVSVAAGRALRSTYCTAAHSIVLAEKWPDERPDDVDFAVMDLAKKVAGDAASVEQGDIDRLRGLGLTDAEVFDVVAAA